MRYSVITFGCRVNQADSLGFEEELRAAGAAAASATEADVVVVNTCSVTATADQGARQVVRRIARDNPRARIVVTGCYATRRPEEVAALPNVVRLVVNDGKTGLGAAVARDLGLTTAERFGQGEGSCGAAIEPGVAGRTAFTLRVQTGCDEPCSYCIIPSTRGHSRSVPIDDVITEIDRVAAAGFREIALTGVHLGSYGRDLAPPASFVTLLRRLVEHDADVRYRISSLEPMECGAELIELVAGSDRFAPHFHLPLQHGCDRVLASMRRPYTAAYYRGLVDAIATRLPHAAIGTDLIVGFPGEDDEAFEATAALVADSPLSHLHVFPYSDRPGTEASRLGGRADGAVVRRRAGALREIGRTLAERFRARQVGTVRPGLTLEDGTLVVTDNYLKVRIPPGLARNERVDVKITQAGDTMKGEVFLTPREGSEQTQCPASDSQAPSRLLTPNLAPIS